MNKLSIGEVIFKLRKEKCITQDQLGNFIGVSTAAVSKWESGISYPDMILAGIYVQKNDFKKARELLQRNLYKGIDDISTACVGLANSYMTDKKGLKTIEKYLNLSINIKKMFHNDGYAVLGLSMEYLNFAETYLKFGEAKKAMDMLQNMVSDIRKNDINKPEDFSSVWCFNGIVE